MGTDGQPVSVEVDPTQGDRGIYGRLLAISGYPTGY
jgi:hypothetical protein